jgi:hypothetical protein
MAAHCGSVPSNSSLDMEARPHQFMEIIAISGFIHYKVCTALGGLVHVLVYKGVIKFGFNMEFATHSLGMYPKKC